MPTITPDAAWPDGALLTLTQWLSPAFPVGAFAFFYSHGLERAIAVGDVGCAGTLRGWIGALLSHGSPRCDAILLAHAMRPEAEFQAISDLALALAAGAERERETLEQGAAFAATVNALTGAASLNLAYPVAVGAAARGLGLPLRLVLSLFLQAFSANLVTVGTRFIPLGQTEGQGVLAALLPRIVSVAAETEAAGLDDLGTASFRGDLASLHHETLSPRMFRT